MFHAHIDVGVTKAGHAVGADDLMSGFRANDNRPFGSAKFDRESMVALGIESNLRKKPERRE